MLIKCEDMKMLGIIIGLLVGVASHGRETLYSCGEVNETPFNGWSINAFNQFSNADFSENTLVFKRDFGGFYTIEMVRKIDELIGFDKLYLQLDYEKENIILNSVTAQFSTDGKSWKNGKNDSPFGPYFSENPEMNDCFVKLKFDIQFFDNSSFTLKSIFIQGKYPETLEIEEPEDFVEDAFYKLFAFQNQINIETNSEEEYEVMIINMTGQVVHRAFKTGSSRVELSNPVPGFYIVGLISGNQFVAKEKVYISSP